MKKINLSLSKLSPVALWALLSNVITKMTGNINFVNPAVAMAILQAALDKLANLIDVARDGSRQDKMKRDNQVKLVKSLLRQQGNYVVLQSNGDFTIQESSGFPMAKAPQPVFQVDTPKGLEASATNSTGELELRFKKVHGAHYYKMYRSETNPNVGVAKWELVDSTTRVRNFLKGYESFKPFFFCVSAVGVNGEGLKSNAVVGRAA